jgi:oligoribonuclease
LIVWCDLETTGLDPRAGSILEIAMIATDDNFEQIGEPFTSIVRPLHMRGLEAMSDYVKNMHHVSGLLDEIWQGAEGSPCGVGPFVLREDVPRLGDVERAAIKWIEQIVAINATVTVKQELRGAPLAGNTVHFDKRWLIEHMDDLERLFSHRIYDVSTLTEEIKRSAPAVYARRPGLGPDGKPMPQHRALDDIRNSIATAKFYRSCGGWVLPEALR